MSYFLIVFFIFLCVRGRSARIEILIIDQACIVLARCRLLYWSGGRARREQRGGFLRSRGSQIEHGERNQRRDGKTPF